MRHLSYDCGFSLGRAPGEPADYTIQMRNEDIGRIIDGAVTRFAGMHGGRVKAEGVVKCGGREAMWYVG
jgi:putative sterol carrier protein